MTDRLKAHIDFLFSGVSGAEDIKEEILQNTVERYNDLVSQGKSPQSAYQLAICGIGDISEILSNDQPCQNATESHPTKSEAPLSKRVMRAIAIGLYIMCPIPLFVLQDETGLCGLLAFVAVATALMVFSGSKASRPSETHQSEPKNDLRKAVNSIIWVIGLCAYLVLSFATKSWFITWIIFPLIGAVQGLVTACLDLKGADRHEI